MNVRLATIEDIEQALRQLIVMKTKNPSKQMKFAEPEPALRYMHLCYEHGQAVMVEGYLILYSVIQPWFSDLDFLIEDLILKVWPTQAPVEVAIDYLDVLKDQHKCVAIIGGDTQVGYMAPKYMAKGYQPLGFQLIKE